MTFRDWAKEFRKQSEEFSRKFDAESSDPAEEQAKSERRRRRQRALDKPPKPDVLPDLDAMDHDKLEILHDETEIEIDQLKRKIATAKEMRERSRQLERPRSVLSAVSDGILGLGEAAINEQILSKRKLLAAIKVKLKKRIAPPAPAQRTRRVPKLSPLAQKANQMIKVEKEQARVIEAAEKAGASPETIKAMKQMFRQKIEETKDS